MVTGHQSRPLRREFARWLLIRRAKRVATARQWQELDEFLNAIREERPERHYADEETP